MLSSRQTIQIHDVWCCVPDPDLRRAQSSTPCHVCDVRLINFAPFPSLVCLTAPTKQTTHSTFPPAPKHEILFCKQFGFFMGFWLVFLASFRLLGSCWHVCLCKWLLLFHNRLLLTRLQRKAARVIPNIQPSWRHKAVCHWRHRCRRR